MADFDEHFMQGPMDDVGTLKLSGTIEHVIYSNDENGFAICDLGTDSNELVTITGTLPYVGEGDVVTVYGRWVHNAKYGRQFKVEQSEKRLPADRASILRYLSSGGVKGIGPKTAQRIVDEFGGMFFRNSQFVCHLTSSVVFDKNIIVQIFTNVNSKYLYYGRMHYNLMLRGISKCDI